MMKRSLPQGEAVGYCRGTLRCVENEVDAP